MRNGDPRVGFSMTPGAASRGRRFSLLCCCGCGVSGSSLLAALLPFHGGQTLNWELTLPSEEPAVEHFTTGTGKATKTAR